MYNAMLNRKTAAEHAVHHLTELVPIAGAPVVEEHYVQDGVWQITLSYVSKDARPNAAILEAREYKTFAVDGRSGEVLSMKIRSTRS
jgi:hypothetical protein